MKLLLLNPYDYKTVQSNPGLLSFLHVLENEKISYAMTIPGPASNDGYKYIEMPANLADVNINHAALLASRVNTNDLTHIVAMDPEGAMTAVRLLDVVRKPDIRCSYVSYEILFSDEIVYANEKTLKEFDLAWLRRCREVLIQDEVRGRMFLKEIGLHPQLYYAPVSPHAYLGANPERDTIKQGLGLPLDKKILIYSGSLAPYAKPDWWIKIAELLPDDYIFLFTCFDGSQYRDPNVARVGRVLSAMGNARFVRKELPANQYMQLLRVCDVGLALFRPVFTHWMNGRNIQQIGLSSGKFCNYLACGLPVICDHSQDRFRDLAATFPVVQTISTPDEVPSRLQALSRIASRDQREACCRKLFQDVLDPRAGIKEYLEALALA